MLTYDMEYRALTDAGFFMLDSLWKDMDLDAIGISAYFPLSATMPDTVMSVAQLRSRWNGIFNDYLVPLKNNNPEMPIYFLEFGYVDAVGSPHMPGVREFENKFMEDADMNGLDDGEETQANIISAFFQVNESYSNLIRGAFLWGNQMASDIDWENSFGQLRGFSLRDKLAEHDISQHYARYTQVPEIPVLIFPVNGQVVDEDTCILVWHACTNATSYRIQLAQDSLFSVDLKDKIISDTLFIARDIAENTEYCWRVKALNRSVESNWSGFTRFIKGSVGLKEGIPTMCSLEQNYPNPFNPRTAISFWLSSDNKIELTIYDITGNKITTLANEFTSAGYYNIDWNASAFPAGLYFYRLEVGNYSETRKMILMK
jgi:hypothetical protein